MITTHLLVSSIIVLVYIKLSLSSLNKKLLAYIRDLQMPLAICFSLGSLAFAFMDLKNDTFVNNSIFQIMALKMLHMVIGSIMSMISDLINVFSPSDEVKRGYVNEVNIE